jgi:pimeloyl-ACP methyl ester carboxylesterase
VLRVDPSHPNQFSLVDNFENVDGVKLHYQTMGEGSDVLLVHGLGANIYCWRKLVPLLAKKHRVWAVDLKGFGTSDKPINSSYAIKAQSDLLLKFAESKGFANPFCVVGNSMGGSIGAQIALDGSEKVSRLVLINFSHDRRVFGPILHGARTVINSLTSVAGIFLPKKRESATAQYMSLIYGPNYKMSQDDVRAYSAPYEKNNAAYFSFLASLRALMKSQLSKNLKDIKQPVLILWGQEDRLLPVILGHKLHKEMPGSLYTVHPSGGHHLQEEDPEWEAARILEFF